jgi:hypothetical protein
MSVRALQPVPLKREKWQTDLDEVSDLPARAQFGAAGQVGSLPARKVRAGGGGAHRSFGASLFDRLILFAFANRHLQLGVGLHATSF